MLSNAKCAAFTISFHSSWSKKRRTLYRNVLRDCFLLSIVFPPSFRTFIIAQNAKEHNNKTISNCYGLFVIWFFSPTQIHETPQKCEFPKQARQTERRKVEGVGKVMIIEQMKTKRKHKSVDYFRNNHPETHQQRSQKLILHISFPFHLVILLYHKCDSISIPTPLSDC